MLTTIEDKLSAIRAINEEKDSVDSSSDRAIKAREVINSIDTIIFQTTSGKTYTFNYLPEEVKNRILTAVEAHYANRRKELIAQAEQLMK